MQQRVPRARHLLMLTPALAACLVVACATNPATGQRQLSLVSEAQEVAMGRDAAAQVQQTIGLVDNPSLQTYVRGVGHRLAAVSERPDLPWTFAVVDDPALNAFALPGGFVYVTRGLLALLTSEAELASVLGHEIGHVTARHSVSQISRAQLAQLGLGLGGALFPEVQQLSSLAGAGLQLLFLKYGRDDEREADRLGFRYLAGQGYEVSEFDDVFAALQRASDGESSTLPGWLSTHPTSAERIASAQQMIAAAGRQPARRVARDEYLQHLDNLIYGNDPRQGFFMDGMFYQPVLNIQFAIPPGWRAQNLPRAVVAMPPDGEAALEFTLSPAASAAQALDTFARRSGAQLSVAEPQRVHGVSALVAAFRAPTAEGVILHGLVAEFTYQNRVFQMLAYSAAGAAPTFAPRLRSAIESFGPISEPGLQSVMPQRIDVVRLSQPRTLADFARAYPSAVPLDRLAILNQAEPTTAFPSRTLLKRVI